MQYDFEHDMSTISRFLQNPYKAKHGELLIGEGGLPQVAELADQSRSSYSLSDGDALGRIAQESQIGERRGIRRQQRPSPTAWCLALMIGDGVLLMALLAFVLLLVPYLHLAPQVSYYALGTWNSKLVWGCLALISWSIAVRLAQAQELTGASRPLESLFRALCALMLTLICWTALTYPFVTDRVAYTKVLLFFMVLAVPALSIWRVILADTMSLPRFHRQAVIVGTSTAGQTIARELRNVKRPSVNVLGYISEDADEILQEEELPVLGGRNALFRLAQSNMIDMIIMAIDYHANPALFQEAIEATQMGISVVPMSMIYESTSGKIPVEHIRDHWYMTLPGARSVSPLYLCWHKVMDITFGLAGMLVLLIILPVVVPLIYLESPGPIFYSQERLGYQRRKFHIHKFRSMCVDAERTGHTMWATKDDARVTRIGRFLRATHLDELPQALNILRGEMSLIGPRPERKEFVTELEKVIPFYCYRLTVKPGLTGWAQVQSGYASTGQEALVKLQYDLYYIKHQSFMLDILIVLKTIVEVVLCHGR